MIDLYCERLDAGFWAEPFNALSNAIFLIAAWFAWRLSKRSAEPSLTIKLLVLLIASIGVGSFIFHTFATRWSMILDLLPILLFQLTFFWIYSQKVMSFEKRQSALLLTVYLLSIVLGGRFPEFFNGSLIYLPALLLLLSLGVFHYLQHKQERYILLGVSGLFMLSLAFRTLDAEICPQFPLGTHFLWHLSCGVIVYLSARALLINVDPSGKNIKTQ
ncbi:ceramidase domain-containing protein [Methylomarinum sp. Ch1-1]|uniref:Ceramidase domain-containing protein n=1 Tax=Methylomarinum roseum TaxID=3067653 RepID=A0AAU7NRZ6_9GAMM|nr:ceramidase domain-containing protein [Methylomarinum sp. Ch1-1]MDP4520255.1 ceramidase domain-containing protein [Methylomarinum sp. Ch1-1]